MEENTLFYIAVTAGVALLAFCFKLILDRLIFNPIKENREAIIKNGTDYIYAMKELEGTWDNKLKQTEERILNGYEKITIQMKADKDEIISLVSDYKSKTVTTDFCVLKQELLYAEIKNWRSFDVEYKKTMTGTMDTLAKKIEAISQCIVAIQLGEKC